MEQFVLGVFQEHLSKYIIGFRKEQVNANLLNGKGEIHNVSINCAFLNEEIRKFTRYIELEDIHVSKLSFYVTSWTNLKKSPICVDIEQVTVKVVEPLAFPPGRSDPKIRQITKSELEQQIKEGLIRTRTSPYNLFDRILDNLTVDIESVKIHFQTLGKFKTKRKGPWNPPEVIVEIRHIRFVTVNEYGQEAPPEEVWRHNHHRKTGSILVFKKIEMDFDIFLNEKGSNNQTDPIKIISGGGTGNKVEVQMAVERRINDGECLAMQIDTFLPEIGIDIKSSVVPLLVHTISGLKYLVAKDRAFVDPLKSDIPGVALKSDIPGVDLCDSSDETYGLTIVSSPDAEGSRDTTASSDDENLLTELSQNSLVVTTLEEELDDSLSASSIEAHDPVKIDENDFETKTSVCPANNDDLDLRPVIVLRNGFVFHDKISMSATICQVTLRGLYANDGNVMVLVNQCTSEFIWPKATQEKGFYVQFSLRNFAIVEKYRNNEQTLLCGGVDLVPDNSQDQAPKQCDESYPLFEDAAIRSDPFGYHQNLQLAQALSLKLTIDFIDNGIESNRKNETDIQTILEAGVDKIHSVIDSSAWCRIFRFIINLDSGGFDTRYFTGDWRDEIVEEILADARKPMKLEDVTQSENDPNKEAYKSLPFLDATIKANNILIRVPALVTGHGRACDFCVAVRDTLVAMSLSSAESVAVAKPIRGLAKDLRNCVNSQVEDAGPPDGLMDSKNQSRAQLTIKGFSIRFLPIVPNRISVFLEHLVLPTDITLIISYDCQRPGVSPLFTSNGNLSISCFAHRLHVNVDFDMVASMTMVLFDLAQPINEIRQTIISQRSGYILTGKESILEADTDKEMPRAIQETDQSNFTDADLALDLNLQIQCISLNFWRQNVPIASLLAKERTNTSNSMQSTFSDSRRSGTSLPILKILDFELHKLMLEIRLIHPNRDNNCVIKASFSELTLGCCDATDPSIFSCVNGSKESKNESNISSIFEEKTSLEILKIGPNTEKEHACVLQIEYSPESMLPCVVAIDINNGNLSLRVEEFELIGLQVLESMLSPTRFIVPSTVARSGEIFPDGTVGNLFVSVFSVSSNRTGDNRLLSQNHCDAANVSSLKSSEYSKNGRLEKLLGALNIEFLFRLRLNNIMLHVPPTSLAKEDGLGLWISQLTMRLSNFLSEDNCKNSMLGSDVIVGNTEVEPNTIGLSLSLNSSQGLVSTKGNRAVAETVVKEFSINWTATESQLVATEMITRGAESADCLKRMSAVFLEFVNRCKILSSNFEAFLPAERNQTISSGLSPQLIALSASTASIAALKLVLAEICEKVVQYNLESNVAFTHQQKEIKSIRLKAFTNEQQKLTYLALGSCHACGWLRICCPQKNDRRAKMTSTLRPRWAVLRRSFLLTFSDPMQTSLVDTVTLCDASLRELTGGQRKSDLKRAFAIVEKSGNIYFVLTGNDSDYSDWTRALRTELRNASTKPEGYTSGLVEADTFDPFAIDSQRQSSETKNSLEGSIKGPIGASLSRAIQTAKAKTQAAKSRGQAVVSNIRKRNENETEIGISTFEQSSEDTQSLSEKSPPKVQLRNRFAGVGQLTKRGIGSALLATKQMALDANEKRRQQKTEISKGKMLEDTVKPNSDDEQTLALTSDEIVELNTNKVPSFTKMGDAYSEVNALSVKNERDMEDSDDRSIVSDSLDDFEGNGKLKMRQKFGATFAKLRGFKQSDAEPPNTPYSMMGAPEEIRLKNVSIHETQSKPMAVDSHSQLDALVDPLLGCIYVKVEIDNRSDFAITGGCDKAESLPPNDSKADVGYLVSQENSEITSNLDNNSSTDTVSTEIRPGLLMEADATGIFFSIIVVQEADDGRKLKTDMLKKSLTEIISLFTIVSQCVSSTPSILAYVENRLAETTHIGTTSVGLSSALGFTIVDTLQLTGKVLDGMSRSLGRAKDAGYVYHAEVISQFLNSVLAIPLPAVASERLQTFLCLSKQVSTTSEALETHNTLPATEEPGIVATLTDICKICESELTNAESKIMLAKKMAEIRGSKTPSLDRLNFQSFDFRNENFGNSLQRALLDVMKERDEAKAKLVSIEVCRSSQRERYSRHAAVLSNELYLAKLNSSSNAPVSQGSSSNINESMFQDADTEVVTLCQQLAGEISARTTSELEIIRLKETHSLYKKSQEKEKQRLNNEIATLRSQLEVERRKVEATERDYELWKKSFETAFQ